LGSDEIDFGEKIKEFRDEGWPEDWDGNEQEIFDENGLNILHYSVMKGYDEAVTVLVEDLDFGKFQFLYVLQGDFSRK